MTYKLAFSIASLLLCIICVALIVFITIAKDKGEAWARYSNDFQEGAEVLRNIASGTLGAAIVYMICMHVMFAE